jgi:hypothetical protein
MQPAILGSMGPLKKFVEGMRCLNIEVDQAELLDVFAELRINEPKQVSAQDGQPFHRSEDEDEDDDEDEDGDADEGEDPFRSFHCEYNTNHLEFGHTMAWNG